MLRKCKKCGVEAHTLEELEHFSANKTSKYGKAMECKTCNNKRKNKYRRNDPSSYRDSNLKWHCINTYNITFELYKERMLTSKCCEICGSLEELCYDHDHDTMEFRGVLCRNCNRAIGQLGDRLENMIRVIRYLSKHLQ
jgi:hypothetical protein